MAGAGDEAGQKTIGSGLHLTYELPEEGGDLQQGDVLKKTDAVRDILEEVHPYYLNQDYTHFLVLTQSCDLVRRGDHPCSARYITLAAVRPFSLALERELTQIQTTKLERRGQIAKKGRKYRLYQFMERVMNNNDERYFYLHAEPSQGLAEDSCAFLALSIAIKSELHYRKCLEARLLSLRPQFQAKLGWLKGNHYSRVGTEDWIGDRISKNQWRKDAKKQLNAICKWVPEEKLKLALESAPDAILDEEVDDIRAHVDATEVPSSRDLVLDALESALQEMDRDEDEAQRIRRRIANDPTFQQAIKRIQ